MKHKIWPLVRKVAASLCISAGVLAVANIETIWRERSHAGAQEIYNRPLGKNKVHTSLPIYEGAAVYKPLQTALSQSLEEDELLDSNPFAHLATLDPLQKIMQKGVARFHRETFRSPNYQAESGYDLLSYEVEHPDGSKSTILAYLEKADHDSSERVPFVIFMAANGESTSYSLFRGGELVEASDLSGSDVQDLISHRLAEGIPLLSVSR